MSAWAEWRLGIAAYWFASAWMSSPEWLTPLTNPHVGNIHGGAVGMRAKPRRPMRFASRRKVNGVSSYPFSMMASVLGMFSTVMT